MDYKTILAFLLSLFLTSVCQAELRDPTRPADYSIPSGSSEEYADFLKLSSIWASGQSKRATINGITAKQGETIFSNVKIIKINTTSVLIEQNGSSRTLSLLTRSYKKPIN